MQPFDWQYKDRMSRIAAAYAAAGIRVSLSEHFINLNFGTVAAGAISAPHTVIFNREADWYWIGTSFGDLLSTPGRYTPELFDNDLSVRFEVGQNSKTLGRQGTITPGAGGGWIPVPAIAGIGRRPYLWPFPVAFHGGDSLTATIHSPAKPLETSTQPRMQLFGVKVYRMEPVGLDRIILPRLASTVLPDAVPEPNPWRAVNGWETLRRRLGEFPELWPYQLQFSLFVTNPLAGTEITQTVSRRIEGDGDFYVLASLVTAQNPATDFEGFNNAATPEAWAARIKIQEESGGITYMNDGVSLGHIFGGGCANDLSLLGLEDLGIRPYIWPVPAIWRSGREIRLTLTHRFNPWGFGVSTVVRIVFIGFKRMHTSPDLPVDVLLEPRLLDTLREFRGRGQLGRVEPFFYAFNFDDMDRQVGLETQSRTVLVTDAAFAGINVLGTTYDPSTGNLSQPSQAGMEALLQFTINEGQRRLQDRPQQFYNVAGIGKRPFNLPKPLVIQPGESLTTIYTPLTRTVAGQGNWDAYVTVAGARIFPGQRRW